MVVWKSVKLLPGLGQLVGFMLSRALAQLGCMWVIISMAPCQGYVTDNTSTPSSSSCYLQLASVLRSWPVCLCSVLNGGTTSFEVTVNQAHALAMPAACNIQTPSIFDCDGTSTVISFAPSILSYCHDPV